MDQQLLCTYASKPCYEPRDLKENGQLHRLCAEHRRSANEAQRRWHSRNQQRKRFPTTSPSSLLRRPRANTAPTRESPISPVQTATHTPRESSLNDDDLALLSALLLDDDEPCEADAAPWPDHWPRNVKLEPVAIEFTF